MNKHPMCIDAAINNVSQLYGVFGSPLVSYLTDSSPLSGTGCCAWHLIEQEPHKYNFDLELMLLDAGLEAGVEQIFDLFHFGGQTT